MPSLLVLGGAESVLADAEAAQALGGFDAVMAINDTIALWPGPIDYGVSLHPDKFGRWLRSRRERGYPGRPQLWAHAYGGPGRVEEAPDRVTSDWKGSSGLFAVKVGREEGFDRIVLAGVPLDGSPHVTRQKPWEDWHIFRAGWHARIKQISPFVRSMSGWTASVFGRPTKAWLAGNHGPNGAANLGVK